MEKFKELVKGGTQSVVHGATAGTEPYIAGVLNETINLPKKVYSAKNLRNLYDVYMDSGKDYVKTKNDYKQAYEEFARQNLGISLAGETIGGLITCVGTIKTGRKVIDLYRLGRETEILRKAYDEVKNYPYKGTRVGKDDVIVEIKPIGDKNTYVIHRGAAIKGDDGVPIVYGKELDVQTGTDGNFGLAKMIHKHKLTSGEVEKVPKILRKYKPYGIRESNNTFQWKVPLDKKHNMNLSFADKGENKLKAITVNRETVRKNKVYNFSKKR